MEVIVVAVGDRRHRSSPLQDHFLPPFTALDISAVKTFDSTDLRFFFPTDI